MMLASPPTVLILRFSSAGDIVLTAPAVQALARAWPTARLVFVTHAAFVPLMAANPYLHAVVALDRREPFAALRARLAAWHPTAILDLHGKARGFILRHAFPSARQVVWCKRSLSQTLAVRLGGARYHAHMHIAARYHHAVETLVGRSLPRGELRHFVTPEQRQRAQALLGELGVDMHRPIIGMAPGAMWETKRWPAESFGALAQWALAQGYQVVLTGSPSEAAALHAVQRIAPRAVSLAGKLDLGTLGGVIAQCRAFVANDSGPMHMARALRVPTVAIFGSTDPGQFDFSGHALLFGHEPCSPCSFHGLAQCPRGHMHCLRNLDVGQASLALQSLLTRDRPAYVLG